MSMFRVNIGVGRLGDDHLVPVSPIVDTGAAHSMLPASLLARLRIPPRQQLGFILADGRKVEYGYGLARFSIDSEEWPCPVIFGPEGNYLLGASALEIFNLIVDPTSERLAPAEWLSLG